MIKYAVEMKVKTSIQLWKESKKEQKYKDCHLYVKRWRERMQEEKIKKIRSVLNQYFNFVQGGVLVQCWGLPDSGALLLGLLLQHSVGGTSDPAHFMELHDLQDYHAEVYRGRGKSKKDTESCQGQEKLTFYKLKQKIYSIKIYVYIVSQAKNSKINCIMQ